MDILIPYDTISVEVRKGNVRISLETSILIIDPSTFLGSTWGMIWGVSCTYSDSVWIHRVSLLVNTLYIID